MSLPFLPPTSLSRVGAPGWTSSTRPTRACRVAGRRAGSGTWCGQSRRSTGSSSSLSTRWSGSASRDSLALLETLLQRGPPNLHLAIACRELPDGLNIAGSVLEGRAAVLTADELRFSKSEISEFFDRRLSRSELAALAAESSGWPIALPDLPQQEVERGAGRCARVAGTSPTTGWSRDCGTGLQRTNGSFCSTSGCSSGWMRSCSKRCSNARTRCCVSQRCPTWSVCSSRCAGGAVDTWRLHPLVREHCVKRRFS